jgi:hypothetical protein
MNYLFLWKKRRNFKKGFVINIDKNYLKCTKNIFFFKFNEKFSSPKWLNLA